MPKVTLTYTLPEETNEHEIAVKAMDYAITWCEVKEFLRQKVKYCDSQTPEEHKLLDEIRNFVFNQEYERLLPEPK